MRLLSLATTCGCSVLLTTLLLPKLAAAHTITVDANAADWSDRTPSGADLGMIARSAAGAGELIWRDAVGDATQGISLAGVETFADMSGFQVTGDATNLYLLVRGLKYQAVSPPQVQIAIDLDQAPSVGNTAFIGSPETSTAAASAWEYLLQTRLRSGTAAPSQTAVLWNTALAQTGTVTVAFDAFGAGMELAVPWSSLGLNGPPTTPVRFTVAVFREDASHNPLEVAALPDALDVLSDYGDPYAVTSPGTASEFPAGNGVVDDYVDVFFDSGGDVRAPVLIDRVLRLSATSGSWVAIKNQLGFGVNLGQFKLGDAGIPDSSEAMYTLGGVALPSASRYVVAANATTFDSALGHLPDAELSEHVAAVPNLSMFTQWAPQALSLAINDEVLLLDGTNTIVDTASWGTSTHFGATAAFATSPGTDVVLVRKSGDTDDCNVDFEADVQCVSACVACTVCAGDACVPQASGTACGDGDACNGVETCDGKGVCANGKALDCDDGNPCTSDECGASTCKHVINVAATCDDNDKCTSQDSCNANGTCQGYAKTCTPPAPTCSDATHSTVSSGGTCQSGACSFVTTVTVCKFGCNAGKGLCEGDPCSGVTCKAPPSQCHQDTGVCSGGACEYSLKKQGAACDDADACTTGDACGLAGACAGVPLLCNKPPSPECHDENTSYSYAASGTCEAGVCDYRQTSQACQDGCADKTGLCAGDKCVGVVCDSPPDACHQDVGDCKAGVCSYELKPVGSSCDDGDGCTAPDSCARSGECLGTDVACNAPPAPHCVDGDTSLSFEANGSCSVAGCDYTPQTTPCASGCDAVTGLCVGDPCAGVACTSPPGSCYLALGSCSAGECSYGPAPVGVACDDGLECTNDDACDGNGECLGNESASCQPGEGGAAATGGAPTTGSGGASEAGAAPESGGAGDAPSVGSGGTKPGATTDGGEPATSDPHVADDAGCGCKLGAARGSSAGSVAGLLLLFGLTLRRRRARV